MITIQIPKNKAETRKKSLYIHEELVLQQYVLDELLSRGADAQYEAFIPAVRYQEGIGTYLTGYGYQNEIGEVVSFAYQVHMDAISGTTKIDHGMYRPFYDCWKEYIQYIQDGIECLDGNTVYRVKLDIKGFYDHIKTYSVRDALYEPIRQALLKAPEKFRCFEDDADHIDLRVEKLVKWILNELYKERFYSAADGKEYLKEEDACGIPQGPNLSAYVANIVLFKIDRIVYQMVQDANQNYKDGKIAVRYGRYVDDMILIASRPELLLEIKNVIASSLYELGLELSHKTDTEDGVTKDEAMKWTVTARGGLGVSAVFDFPEDTLESALDECDEYDITDRRTALKLLQSALAPMLYEGVDIDVDEQLLIDAIFKMNEIRINDIVRFSEYLLAKASEKSENLYFEYLKFWKKGMSVCPSESMLQMEGIEVYVFLESCTRILMRQAKSERTESYSFWANAERKIKSALGDRAVLADIEGKMESSELLKMNAWMLRLRGLQLEWLMGVKTDMQISVTQNEYWQRWLWCSRGVREGDELEFQTATILEIFHYMSAGYMKANNLNEINELNSQIENYGERYRSNSINDNNLLLTCILVWKNTSEKEIMEKNVVMALRVILNLLKPQIKAETISRIPAFSSHLFSEQEDMRIMPVFPGVEYPGIMGYVEKEDGTALMAERCDFIEDEKNVVKNNYWNPKDGVAGAEAARFYALKWQSDHESYISLEDYFDEKIILEPLKILEKITDVYLELANAINKVYQNYPEQKLILSKKNVILVLEQDNRKQIKRIETGISYLVSNRISSDVVAVEKMNGSYMLQSVNQNGAPFWVAGELLADACRIEKINLIQLEQGQEYKDHASMLFYTIHRMRGYYLHRSANQSKHSYYRAMLRSVENAKGYIAESDQRDLYLENTKIENDIIKYRMQRKQYALQDASLELAIWAKNYLRFGYSSLISCMESRKISGCRGFDLERRVSQWYCYLAEHLKKISNVGGKDFAGIRTLSAGLFADAILMNLRMQVLERIRALSQEQRDLFLQDDMRPPFAELGLEEKVILTIPGRSSWEDIWKNLLNRKYDRNIRFVTHLGWGAMLAKLHEIEKGTRFILKENNQYQKEAKRNLADLIEYLQYDEECTSQKEDEFPFEALNGFYQLWNTSRVLKIVKILNSLDNISGIQVELRGYSEYRQYIQHSKIFIDYDEGQLRENLDFLTFSKVQNTLETVERRINHDDFLYTISLKQGKALGISTIISSFGNVLQKWERSGKKDEGRETLEKTNQSEVLATPVECETSEKFSEELIGTEGKVLSENSEASEKLEVSESTNIVIPPAIRSFQRNSWEKRSKKPFDSFDRIALFQMNIDCSYYPPDLELCLELSSEQRNDSYGKSCAEFRRRKLLAPVFEACHLLKVEILLLPEYSVRPETVEWIREEIEEKEYCFSVWAGTFRISPGYIFDESIWGPRMNSEYYWHSALLPVVQKDKGKGKVEIVVERFKKYPALALYEDINPIPAFNSNFIPVMKKINADKQVGDARDDVTEVICAEMFVVSAVCNYPSFLKSSLDAYNRYSISTSIGEAKNVKKQIQEDDYRKQMVNDLFEFGKYTAIYQEENRHNRTPIILVPACTTRATDYYIWAQGDYLAAGIKTVFCNPTLKAGIGGSCFVGQNSWDDNRLDHNEKIVPNTIYHGLNPGMYMQGKADMNRGALGKEEQALLVYDINPYGDEMNPNPESMMDSLSVVAHIPILEKHLWDKKCDKCSNKYLCIIKKKTKEGDNIELNLNELEKHCKERKNTTMNENETDAKKMGKYLEEMGIYCNSEWLKERGRFYEKYYKSKPQGWCPPTLVDWMFISIDYREFVRDSDRYIIQVPQGE